MKRAPALLLCLLLVATCGGEKPKPLSEPGEKLYTVRGIVLSRNSADNSLRLDHEAVPGFMEAMTMDYNVRGADVAALPKDKSRIEARLHVTNSSYWITDVKAVP